MTEEEREALRDRIVRAAVEVVYNPKCRASRRELEDAVAEYIGAPIERVPVVRMTR